MVSYDVVGNPPTKRPILFHDGLALGVFTWGRIWSAGEVLALHLFCHHASGSGISAHLYFLPTRRRIDQKKRVPTSWLNRDTKVTWLQYDVIVIIFSIAVG